MYSFLNNFHHCILFRNLCAENSISLMSTFLHTNKGNKSNLKLRRYFSICKQKQSSIGISEMRSRTLKPRSIYYYVQRQKFQSLNDFWLRRKQCNQHQHDLVQPGNVSPPRSIPNGILLPEYAYSGVVGDSPSQIEIKDAQQIELLKKSCKLASKILREIKENVQIGVTTDDLDRFVHERTIQHRAYPSPLNYRGFPKSVCTSVNNVACHGIPDDRPLQLEDIISIDISVFKNGYHGDCAATFGVGKVDKEGERLIEVAKTCLTEAISICYPGQYFNAIGETISDIADASGFSVVPSFCGHGIGTYFHGPPQILHYRNDMEEVMKPGMTFTIEPVLCEGEPDIVVLEDGWTAMTVDNKRCAQFEHTVLITESGVEILTS